MNRLLGLLILAALMSGCASNDSWSRADTARELAFQVSNVADAYQTSKYRDLPTVQEGMPVTRAFIGANPSKGDTAMYFGTLAISHFVISRALPEKWRPWFQRGTAGFTAYTVYNNCQKHDELCR